MHINRSTQHVLPAIAVGVAAALMLSAAVSRGDADGTQATMDAIFENMQLLLEESADEMRFGAPANAERVVGALREVSDQAALLAGHAELEDTETAFLGSALERYASWALWAYERGETDRARALLHDATDICIACHTRLPSGDSPLASAFLDSNTVNKLSLRQQANLQIATRHFDGALGSLQALLAGDSFRNDALTRAVSDYLIISIRVKKDTDGPKSMLAALSKREDLTDALRDDIAHWRTALHQLESKQVRSADLGVARALLEETLNEALPTRRAALIEQVTASGVLQRYLQSHRQPSPSTAEAYFLLGLSEYRITGDHWLPRAELYLEKAILTAPTSQAAAEAYDVLENKLKRFYTRASVTHLPEEVATHLGELKSMLTGDVY